MTNHKEATEKAYEFTPTSDGLRRAFGISPEPNYKEPSLPVRIDHAYKCLGCNCLFACPDNGCHSLGKGICGRCKSGAGAKAKKGRTPMKATGFKPDPYDASTISFDEPQQAFRSDAAGSPSETLNKGHLERVRIARDEREAKEIEERGNRG